jgi:lysyl-tRNA synthetase class 1
MTSSTATPAMPVGPVLRTEAEKSAAWPFEEARKLVARLARTGKQEALFETGYGPSGLPHLGTFGEVARTSMVRHAFTVLTEGKIKTRLIAFSDDMDGLRKVPDNVPNRDMLAKYIGQQLTKVPDPFGTHASFGEHNNARLRSFLDAFGFDYEFMSSTEAYRAGRFDATLRTVLERWDAVMAGARPNLFAVLPRAPAHRPGDAGADRGAQARHRQHRLARPRHRRALRDTGDRRPLQAAMEARLGNALGGARRRLRDGR